MEEDNMKFTGKPAKTDMAFVNANGLRMEFEFDPVNRTVVMSPEMLMKLTSWDDKYSEGDIWIEVSVDEVAKFIVKGGYEKLY